MALKYEKPVSNFTKFDEMDVLTISLGNNDEENPNPDLGNDDVFDINSNQ